MSNNLPERRRSLTPTEAGRVWDVPVTEAGASPKREAREAFKRYLTTEDRHGFGHEFRFCGLLGAGGKLLFDDRLGAHVSCYREDQDDARTAIIENVDRLLAETVPSREVLIQREATHG